MATSAPAKVSTAVYFDSIASPANENYGRELLELHSLGASAYLNDRFTDWRDRVRH